MNGSSSPGSPTRRPLFRRPWVTAVLLVGLPLLLVGVLLAWTWWPHNCKVNMLVDLDPNRAMLAERLAAEAKRHRLEIDLSSQAYGSLDAIELIDEPNPIDLALVPGGVARRTYAN